MLSLRYESQQFHMQSCLRETNVCLFQFRFWCRMERNSPECWRRTRRGWVSRRRRRRSFSSDRAMTWSVDSILRQNDLVSPCDCHRIPTGWVKSLISCQTCWFTVFSIIFATCHNRDHSDYYHTFKRQFATFK
jgi:hypothetical protein